MITLSEHASQPFDAELNKLFASLGEVKSHLHRFIALIQLSLGEGRNCTEEARRIDASVNDLEFTIDQQVMRVISKYTPMLEELRLVLAVVKVGSICEQIADALKNTVKRAGKLSESSRNTHAASLLSLLDKVALQLDAALEEFSLLDEHAMLAMLMESDKVHQVYKQAIAALPHDDDRTALVFLFRNLDMASGLAFDIAKIGFAARYNRKFIKPKR
jgi:phosphate uptake regulator